MSEKNVLYICLHDGFWLFHEASIYDFLKEVDALPPSCPECKQPMHQVHPVEDRLALRVTSRRGET